MLDIKITRTTCPKEKPQDESKLGFGKKFTDHMFVMDYTEGEGRPDDRIFPISKAYLHHEMNRGAKAAGVKRIRIHDLRHSHVSLLIEMGFSAGAIAERVGHESIDITYRYAHLFTTKQTEMANRLNSEWTKEEDKPCPEK